MDFNPASPPEAPTPDWFGHGPHGRAERRLAALEHLSGIGIRLAEVFAEKAVTDANTAWISPDPHVDPGIPFAAMARMVRQTLALQVKFEKEERLAAAPQTARRDADRGDRRTRRRNLIKDAVTAAIRNSQADRSDTERLLRDFEERLHDAEADERFDDGPVGQVVARICKAIGISVDLSLFEADTDLSEDISDDGAAANPPRDRAAKARPPAPKPPAAPPATARSPHANAPDERHSSTHPLAGPRTPSIILPGEPDPLLDEVDPSPD